MEQIYQYLSEHNKKYLHRFQRSCFCHTGAVSGSGKPGTGALYRSLRASLSQICFCLSFHEAQGKRNDAELLSDRTFYPDYRISPEREQY